MKLSKKSIISFLKTNKIYLILFIIGLVIFMNSGVKEGLTKQQILEFKKKDQEDREKTEKAKAERDKQQRINAQAQAQPVRA